MTVPPFETTSGHCLLPQPDSTGYGQSARFNVSVMFLSLLFTLKMQGCCCWVSINVVVGVFVHSTWSAAAHIHFQRSLRRHCIITADSIHSNGDENTHASSFKKVTMLHVVDEKESKSRLKECNSGSTVIGHNGKKCCEIGSLVLWLSFSVLPDVEGFG